MRESILKNILYGRFSIGDSRPITSERFQNLETKINIDRDEIEKDMSKDSRRKLDRIFCMIQEKDGIEMEEAEYEHFMLGLLVGMELSEYKDYLLN